MEEKLKIITNDIMNIFSKNNETVSKSECNELLDIIFEGLFNKKLKKSNFEEIFNTLSKNNEKFLTKQELEPIINSFMVSFDVNYISNSENFKSQDDIICIKMKNSLPINYYLKKMDD